MTSDERGNPSRGQRAVYDEIAWLYDRHWGPVAERAFLPMLERLLLPRLPEAARILDLCCGTGQLSRAISELGYHVVGLDGSAEMIRLARRNAPLVEFAVADARSFALPEPCHAAVSTFDSLNHIMSLGELESAFRSVGAALRSGGLFVFDLNMEDGFWERSGGSFGFVEDEHACIVRTSYEPEDRMGRFDITVFRREDQWRRSNVVLFQRCYTLESGASGPGAGRFRRCHGVRCRGGVWTWWDTPADRFSCVGRSSRRHNAVRRIHRGERSEPVHLVVI